MNLLLTMSNEPLGRYSQAGVNSGPTSTRNKNDEFVTWISKKAQILKCRNLLMEIISQAWLIITIHNVNYYILM